MSAPYYSDESVTLYPDDWPAISHRIRFDRAGGRHNPDRTTR